MKTRFSIFGAVMLSILLVSSCMEDTPNYMDFEGYEFTTLDESGGAWKTIILDQPTQIEIPAPEDPSSDAYMQELASLKQAMGSLTPDQKGAIEYWTANPVLRWNEVALELAAKYNLIPGPNPDGTYTLPDPTRPEGPPPFPFAHPPYTSRALSYLSVAQFDGLVAAWHYKYQFKRPAPYQVDASITPAYPKNDLPAYPSDGAMVAAASKEILKVMFPLERDYLEGLYQQHVNSLVHAGINVTSDVEAGVTLGLEMAKLALQRASTDGMSRAQTPRPVSDSIKNAAFQRFGWQWDNQEIPVRPVGLTPMFGRVRMWNVPNVEEVRSPPPPAPGSAEFERDAEELEKYARYLTLEQRRIANWWEDGLGSYTPPGHWNKFAKEAIVKYELNPLRTARVFAYMNTAIMDAGIACWDTKYYYHYPRPIQTIKGFKTILGTPNFPAYTSGHSTFSSAAAEVLSHFFPDDADEYRRRAREAADSRLYGGIHYRFDADVGVAQGKAVGEYAVNRARADGAD